MIAEERVSALNSKKLRQGEYCIYWMQSSHRADHNPALEYAILRANRSHLPLVVYSGIDETYPSANLRHYTFMLQGIFETARKLEERGLLVVLRKENPPAGVVELAAKAAFVVTDVGYLRIQREWYEYVAEHARCPVIAVEGNVVVPVKTASPKQEYSAATFRPRLSRLVPQFLDLPDHVEPLNPSERMEIPTLIREDPGDVIGSLSTDRRVGPAPFFTGGATHADARLQKFLVNGLDNYPDSRNDPARGVGSDLSPYLHYGQISPVHVAREVLATGHPSGPAYLEELVVRRELAVNYVFYNPDYDTIAGIPSWARRSLDLHRNDRREYLYTDGELESAATHDTAWNAAQRQMVCTGKMHGYMRMYWGKKIIEWSPDPETAFLRALYLNDRYELDGRDPNGYTGIAWCFGTHDRPWKERAIFGKVRYMNHEGLKRKFRMDDYGKLVDGLCNKA